MRILAFGSVSKQGSSSDERELREKKREKKKGGRGLFETHPSSIEQEGSRSNGKITLCYHFNSLHEFSAGIWCIIEDKIKSKERL